MLLFNHSHSVLSLDLVADCRFERAVKYGYQLPKIEEDSAYEMLTTAKDPRQVFYGLEPGWLINIVDKTIIKRKQ